MTIPTLLITPHRAALLAGHDNELDVLVRVQAPQAPAGTPSRNPLHLSLVIDRSGSMAGEPLDHAKRCAEFMLDGLQPADRLWSSRSTTAWRRCPPRRSWPRSPACAARSARAA
jgi:Ca-activated chloride channel family protein